MVFSHSTPVPTDEELQQAHPAPSKLLHPGVPADKFYHLVLKEKLWRSWSGDSFGIKYFDDAEKPFEVDIKGHAMSLRDRMVVRDSESKTEVAVILGMFLKWETTFKIYTFAPNYDDQTPSETQKHDSRDLYEFAECKDKFFSVRKTLTTSDGSHYVMDGVGKVFAAHRQMRITCNDKPCMYAVEKNLGFFTGNQWEVKIAPGIDPVLMVAFMVVMDEMNENNQ